MKRKGSIAAAPPPACPPSAIALPPGAAKSKTYVEFHASMSLDNPTSALSFMTPSSSPSSSAAVAPLSSHHQQLNALLPVTYENTTLEQILKQRFQVWSQAHEVYNTSLLGTSWSLYGWLTVNDTMRCDQVIEALAPLDAYARDVAALRKLQELHHLCNILLHYTLHLVFHARVPIPIVQKTFLSTATV